MKTKIIIYLLFWVPYIFGQNNDRIIEIRHNYNKIKNMIQSSQVDTLTSMNFSTEGSEIIRYKDKNEKIILLIAKHYGEFGKMLEEYYFTNDSLFFVYTETHNYNVPININEAKAKELGCDPFDPSKTTIEEDRYYFYRNSIIRWIDKDRKIIENDTLVFKNIANDFIKFTNQICNLEE